MAILQVQKIMVDDTIEDLKMLSIVIRKEVIQDKDRWFDIIVVEKKFEE